MRLPAACLLLFAVAAVLPAAAQTDPAARQAAVEADDDLGPRAQAALFRARTRLDEGDAAGAAEALRTWLAGGDDRDHHLLRFELGAALLAQDQAEAARVQLRRAVELEPAFARAWLRLGEAAYGTGRYAEAAGAFVRAHELLPDPPPEVMHYAAVCRLEAGDAAGAVDLLEPLVAGDRDAPDAPFAWYRTLAAAALEADRPGRARPHLARLVAARPADPAVWDLAWRFAAGTGEHRDAAILLKAEGFLTALDAGELDQLGQLFAAVGIPLEAARAWERAAALAAPQEAPTTADTARLARAWLAAHEPERARATLARALADAGPDRTLLELLGDVNLADDDAAAAYDAYAKAAALAPADGRPHLMAGWCALELGRRADARRHLTDAAAFPDQEQDARELLRRLAAD